MTQPHECEDQPPSSASAQGDAGQADSETQREETRLIDVYAQAPADYDGTCLRPLGLCELGGSCDACWYNHTRENSIGERPDKPE